MFKRAISETLIHTIKTFPVTVLTGPRQSGKTTLLQTLFPDFSYITLESPDRLLQIQSDPRSFFHSDKSWIVDEAQNYPNLFSYIQEYVDVRKRPGQFILSGSQNFLLTENVSQSLAGRSAILELLPLSYHEFQSNSAQPNLSIWEFLYHGTYPRPYNEKLDVNLWYNSYIRTYLERDIRSLLHVKDLTRFQLFLKLCAGWHGQLLNLSAIAQSCGISQTTATHWLSILETSYILYRLPPFHQNFKKRLVKTPKLYFYDSAIVCQLLGIESPEHLKIHTSRGAIFEGFILSEIIKFFIAQGKTAPLYFWRDHQGHEVDAILALGQKNIALEIKASMTYNADHLTGLRQWQTLSNSSEKDCYMVYAGSEPMQQKGTHIYPWNQIYQMLMSLN